MADRFAGWRAGRVRGDHDLNPGLDIRADLTPAAVLVALVERAEGVSVLFTERTAHLAHHAGQISFPGGRLEASDRTPEEAALRETAEEIGLEPAMVRIVGRLDAYASRTGFLITPVVGLVAPPLTLARDPFEVAAIFEVPLAFLLDGANWRRESRPFGGVERFFYSITYEGRYIWGITAGVLINLREVLAVP